MNSIPLFDGNGGRWSNLKSPWNLGKKRKRKRCKRSR